MKVMKKMFSVMLIFVVMQLLGMVFVTNESTAGFFDDAFSSGKKWKEMGGSNSEAIIQNAQGVFDATDEIYGNIRAIGIALFLINIVITLISLSVKNTGNDIAGIKLTIGFTFALALLFIFARPIMDFLQRVFEGFEGMR